MLIDLYTYKPEPLEIKKLLAHTWSNFILKTRYFHYCLDWLLIDRTLRFLHKLKKNKTMQESLTFMMVWSFCRIMMFKNVIWVTFTLVTAISFVVGSHPIQLTLKKHFYWNYTSLHWCCIILREKRWSQKKWMKNMSGEKKCVKFI